MPSSKWCYFGAGIFAIISTLGNDEKQNKDSGDPITVVTEDYVCRLRRMATSSMENQDEGEMENFKDEADDFFSGNSKDEADDFYEESKDETDEANNDYYDEEKNRN